MEKSKLHEFGYHENMGEKKKERKKERKRFLPINTSSEENLQTDCRHILKEHYMK